MCFKKDALSSTYHIIGVQTTFSVTSFTNFSIDDAYDDVHVCVCMYVCVCVCGQAHDKYFSVAVNVHAPVLIVPISETSSDGFMVDLGSIAVQNTLLVPDQKAYIDAFGIRLDSFKVSR